MVMPRSAPVGVFDSGIGGLTVAHEVIRQLPHESVLYFGDTARVPYGPKSPDTVRRYSREIAGFLRDQGVKGIVIACNTATAHALTVLRDEFDMPVIGVVEPGARAAVSVTTGGRIGVIGTVGTIKSGAYERAIRAINSDVFITARACPLFVPLVEEGWTDHEATRLIARQYLEPLVAADIDTLVLGCTHYPLLKPLLRDVLGPDVRLIDSAEETAAETARTLAAANLTAAADADP
ncbi:MAG TPA: glutamate racemase, partial [Gemmatimonadaceae bacterium]|nr:glutamate racemase [Gemmatimonadaceae bacterium]